MKQVAIHIIHVIIMQVDFHPYMYQLHDLSLYSLSSVFCLYHQDHHHNLKQFEENMIIYNNHL